MDFCPVIRTMYVSHGSLSLTTGAVTNASNEWETRACGVPLFGPDRAAGMCRACASGWTHPHNYREGDANDPATREHAAPAVPSRAPRGAVDLTEYARTGYSGAPNPNIGTSPAWFAHELGAHFQTTGRSEPRDVRMGRGDSIRANDMRFRFRIGRAAGVAFERVE
jgi:hypothetical protein